MERSVEGQYRPGPWLISEGWIPSHYPVNFWQCGYDPLSTGNSAMVEACVSAYSQTIAMCPGDHWKTNENTGGRERQKFSALSRILRRPNTYQSMSDFMLNLVRNLYMEGNAYVLCLRNDRNEIATIHLMTSDRCHVRIAQETGDIFYQLAGNEIVERMFFGAGADNDILSAVPKRDVMHIRLHTPRHPLLGETPLAAAALDVATGNAMLRQQLQFYLNQARPSFVLTTDLTLTAEHMSQLRARWDEQSKGLDAGGTPILAGGLKPHPISTSAKDSVIAELMKYTEQQVALAFRIPMQILGLGGTPFASTELLNSSWLASGLGFAMNHIEEAFGNMFGLYGYPDEYVEFDTRALLRSDMKSRYEGYQTAIKSGVLKINEARNEEGNPKVDGGDDIRVQQQDVPLDWHEKQLPANVAPPAAPKPEEEPEVEDDSRDATDYAQVILAAAKRHAERTAA